MQTPTGITLDALMERYDALLLDAYGVLVDLDGALPGAAALLDRLDRQGMPYWVLSNTAARLPEHAAARYRDFGLKLAAGRILTSGTLLAPYYAAHGLVGSATLVLGPEDSRVYVERAGGRPVPVGEDFDVLVLADQAGYALPETLDEVIGALFDKIDRGEPIPLLLPNPDLIYPRRRGFGITAGSLALILEAVLARRYPGRDDLRFVRLGKPHPALFQAAAEAAASRRLVMIGDQLETDIQGAHDFGIDSVLVAGGVSLAGSVGRGGPMPTFQVASLQDLL
jgi:HAD superfamily hydrolase (TIGR01450 family)